jgi:hypothetical protein
MATDRDFKPVFEQLKDILQPYAPHLTVKVDTPEHYYLDAPYAEQYKRELFFGAVQVRKNYVSYYLMPVYMYPALLDGISEGLQKRMQGKSCFNFKRVDEDLFSELAELTRRSFDKLRQEQLV